MNILLPRPIHLLPFLFCSLLSGLLRSQESTVVDSIIRQLKTNTLSEAERTTSLRNLAFYHPDLDSSLYYARRSLGIAARIKMPVLEAEAYEEISHIQHELGNNSASLKASLAALRIYEKEGLEERQAASYTQVANNYISNEDYPQAIAYLLKAKVIFESSDQIENALFTLINLGEAYRLSGKLEKAQAAFEAVLRRNTSLRNGIAEGYALGNLGMTLFAQQEYDTAKEKLIDALKILTPIEDAYSVSIYQATLGEIYAAAGSDMKAEETLLNALGMAQQGGLKEQIRDFSKVLTQFYSDKKEFQKAFQYQSLFQVYNDSLLNRTNIQEIEQLKAAYEIDKRESEIGLLQTITSKQKKMVTLLVTSVLIVVFFLYLLFQGNIRIKKANKRLSKQKKIIEKREQEKIVLLQELNHRVKNNLQMISSLLNLQSRTLEEQDAKEALIAGKNRVEALSLVHRKLYRKDLEARVCLKEYIEELVLGLFHAYNANFKPTLTIPAISIDVDKAIPLALLMNEMVVNALKYAYTKISDPTLSIQIQKNDAFLTIQVADNGIGFTPEDANRKNSFGLKLINTLVTQLKGSIEKVTSGGTHWNITIKTMYDT